MSIGDSTGLNVIAKARAGDLQGAISAGEADLAIEPANAALRMFVGVLCCREGELARGITHLRRVVIEQSNNLIASIELARALLAAGDEVAVLDIASDADPTTLPGRELMRLRAHALQRMRRATEARDAFRGLIAADCRDFESHNGLGLALLALEDHRAALEAFREATRLRPTGASFWLNLSQAAADASEWREAANAAERAVTLTPDQSLAWLASARAEAGSGNEQRARSALDRALSLGAVSPEQWAEIAGIYVQMRDFDEAERAFRCAIRDDVRLVQAWVGLGGVLERLNRQEDLEAHLEAAASAGVVEGPLMLLRAQFARKAGRHADALVLARAAPPEGDRIARAQLIGTLADRLGDYEVAFSAFSEANAAIASVAAGMETDAEANLANYASMRRLMTPKWLSRLAKTSAPPEDGRRDPLFIFGFPRSGTTLIDTMLSGHPDAAILEEEGIIQRIASTVGRAERVPQLSPREVGALRDRYFAEVDTRVAMADGMLTVDKEPFGLSSVLLLHRLFPDARFVFAERHPCDVVLSCWMTSMRFDHRVGSFYDLVAIARLYDAVLGFWTQCVSRLPIATSTVRYERLIIAPKSELLKLADFAGLDWQPALLTNEENAAKRTYIGSPSYAQVREPLYTHAAGRWTRYRPWIDGILPILAPWIERLGYSEP